MSHVGIVQDCCIRVNGGDRQALVVQIVIHHVALDLRVGEDQSALGSFTEDQVEQRLALGALLSEDDLLLDVLMGAANPTDLDTYTLFIHILFRQSASRLGEGSREHEVSVVSIRVLI